MILRRRRARSGPGSVLAGRTADRRHSICFGALLPGRRLGIIGLVPSLRRLWLAPFHNVRDLPHVAGYASDDHDVIAQLEALTSGSLPKVPVLVLARGLGVRAERWRHGEQGHLTGRLLQLARSRQILLAAAEPPESAMPAALVRRFPVRVLSRGDHVMLLAPDGQQRLPLRRLTPTDVDVVSVALARAR